MDSHRNYDKDPTLSRQDPMDVDDTREPWSRPRLTRLGTQSTLSAPGAGADGGTGFNQFGGGPS